ncbi:MAG TPA: XRE family transcriptional regulator [Euryarchaeota archaeon]|nr:XRE family transcriptional regulator [Euryarchaeota archaeon]
MVVTAQRFKESVQEIGGEIVASEIPGRTIKELRESMGVTQEEIGKLLGLRRETISRIENGNISPSFTSLKNFSRSIAALRAIRELFAREDASLIKKEEFNLLRPNFLRIYLNLPGQDVKLLYNLGEKGYLRSKKRILKVIK